MWYWWTNVKRADIPQNLRVEFEQLGEAVVAHIVGRPLSHGAGNAWGSHDQHRPMAAACKAAGIEPAIGMHTLRHTYASSLVQAGVSLAIVAEALGHADTRMVSKHYGHLAPSHVADAIRAHLPALGIEINRTVTRL